MIKPNFVFTDFKSTVQSSVGKTRSATQIQPCRKELSKNNEELRITLEDMMNLAKKPASFSPFLAGSKRQQGGDMA